VLKSGCSNRTYVGATNNFKRRLRQHNGEIKGGARATFAKRPWEPVVVVSGFDTQSFALKFEWALKHFNRKRKYRKVHQLGARGVNGRIQNLKGIMGLERVTSSAPLTIDKPLAVTWHDDEAKELFANLNHHFNTSK